MNPEINYIKAQKSHTVRTKRCLYEKVYIANSCFPSCVISLPGFLSDTPQVTVSNPVTVAEQVMHR